MKKVESIVILIIMTLVMLTGCSAGKNQHEANDDFNEQESLIVGDVELPDNVFSIITFIDNDVVYMADDSENEISIHKFNLASKENSIIGKINDYLMNPANNAVDGKTVYMNYMTLEAERKMVAIDLESLKQEVVVSERDISGLVYCTSMNGNIYSLMHTNDGKSLIKKYIPNSNKETIFIEYEENQVINAIATEGDSLYVLLNSGNKLVIQQIDEEGNTVEEHDVTYVLDQIDSQIGQFYVIRDSFYIRTFSDTSISYKFDGTRLDVLFDSSITLDSTVKQNKYSFFFRYTNNPILIVASTTGTIEEFKVNMSDDNVIRYIYADCNNDRLLVSVIDENGENEKTFVWCYEEK